MYINPVTGEAQDTNPETGLTDYELEERYIEMLNEVYGTVNIAGLEYDTAQALKETDPIAYRVGLSDYESFRSGL